MKYKIGDYFLFIKSNCYIIGRIKNIRNKITKENFFHNKVFDFEIIEGKNLELILENGDIRISKAFCKDSRMYKQSVVSSDFDNIKDKAMVELL